MTMNSFMLASIQPSGETLNAALAQLPPWPENQSRNSEFHVIA